MRKHMTERFIMHTQKKQYIYNEIVDMFKINDAKYYNIFERYLFQSIFLVKISRKPTQQIIIHSAVWVFGLLLQMLMRCYKYKNTNHL